MKKIIIYLVFGIIGIVALGYFLGEQGALAGLMGFLGLGGKGTMDHLKEKGAKLDKQADQIKKDLKEIEKERKNLKINDLSPEEEKDYWKDQ